MKILITCGPASAAIDQVRRITNHSTGELGEILAGGFAALGHEVVCLRGAAATAPLPKAPVTVKAFETNHDLIRLLEEQTEWPDAVLHAAALADFEPWQVEADGAVWQAGAAGKIRSSVTELLVRFRPAPKVIAHLRDWFPRAFIAGWKYEVEGSREEAWQRGRQQVAAHRLDGCFVNGPVCAGAFFWVDHVSSTAHPLPGKHALVSFLLRLWKDKNPAIP